MAKNTETKVIQADIVTEELATPKRSGTRKPVPNIRSNEEILKEMNGSRQTNSVEKGISEGAHAIAKSNKSEKKSIITRINDKGEINLSDLSETEIKECREIGKRLDVHDANSISNFGSDLQKVMQDSSKNLLSGVKQTKLGDETREVLNEMMDQISLIKLDEIKEPNMLVRIVRKIPLLNKLLFSIDKFMEKYDDIEKKVSKCEEKLEAVQVIALRDNTALQHDFETTTKNIALLEKLIVAAKMKSQEMETGLEIMKADPDHYTAINIQDMEHYKHDLDKKIHNMIMWRMNFTQSLFRIRDIQRANITSSNDVSETIHTMMPMLREQLVQAQALYNLKQGLNANKAVKESFNKILRQNADAAHDLAVEAVKLTEESNVTLETLQYNQERLVQTMTDVKAAWDEGEAKRKEADKAVMKMYSVLENLTRGIDPNRTIETESPEAIEAKYLS